LLLEEIIILGTVTSLVYALLALGFTLIYGVSGVINLAHGALVMVGAYIFGALVGFFPSLFPAGFSHVAVVVLAVILTTILTGIIGSIFYRLTLHSILGDQIATLVVSITGCMLFAQLIWLVFGATLTARFPVNLFPGYRTLLGVTVLNDQTLGAVVSIILFVSLSIFIAKSRTGMAMKALSQDIEAAMLMGISVEGMYMLTSAIAGAIASIAGVFIASIAGAASGDMWLSALSISFSVVILGGLGNIKGTIVGAVIFGYSVEAITLLGGGGLVASFPFIVLIIVLLIRPKGLFGKHVEME